MNIAPMIACNVATQNAIRCSQMAATNAARAAEAEREYDEYEDGDECGEDEDSVLHLDAYTTAAIVAVALFAVFFAAIVIMS